MGSIRFMQVQNLAIVLVTYKRADLLKRSLSSLALAIQESKDVYHSFNFRTYLCINGEDNESYQLALQFQKQDASFSMKIDCIPTPVTPAAARNNILQSVKDEFVFFMDDDVFLPKDIFLNFLRLACKFPEVDVWGGPNVTPIESSCQQKDCGWLLSQPLLVGPIAQRYALVNQKLVAGGQYNLMLCNLFVRHSILGTGFEPFFKTAEENELIYRLQEKRCPMFASHDLYVWHERRANYLSFVRQIFFYGYGRGQLLRRVSIMRQKLVILALFLFLFASMLFFVFPMIVFVFTLIWLFLINFMYLLEFRRLNAKIFILPLLIYFAYLFGLFSGYQQTLYNFFKTKELRV
jgi:succinoglycan biosynthesis protein ExoA